MINTDFLANRVVVFISALIYWIGVFIQARRIRRRIGRSPNVNPRGPKEKLLWAGWVVVVVLWLALPFLAGGSQSWAGLRYLPSLCGPISFSFGIGLVIAGYAGTLWCYAAMGNAWRMGVNRAEKTRLVTRGPFQFVRHPIYLFQMVMLAGAALLLPTTVSLAVLVIHIVCCAAKAVDEEAYLRAALGNEYRDYLSRTGRFFPKLRSSSK
jgi:protein-S-isoprenylcysteine O-methyltransferase Ste14